MTQLNTFSVVVRIAVVTVTVPCFATTNDLERAILSFPEVSASEYRPDVAVASANALITAGEEAASATLEQVATSQRELNNSYQIAQKVCHLCRLLYRPKTASELLRPPRLGGLSGMPYNSMNASDWPDLPFAVVDDVPLSMSLGYNLAGKAELAKNYLAYCKTNGVFRTHLYPVPTSLVASNAFNKVLNSAAWKSLKWKDEGVGWHYDHNEGFVKEMLWQQVERMGKAPIQQK